MDESSAVTNDGGGGDAGVLGLFFDGVVLVWGQGDLDDKLLEPLLHNSSIKKNQDIFKVSLDSPDS